MYTIAQYREAVRQLESVQFTREQGEILMQIVEERQHADLADLATKRDLEDLRKDMRHEIAEIRTELKTEISNIRKDMKFWLLFVGVMAALSPHAEALLNIIRSL
ncbi:CCDC90 family protein [Cardiobacterium valvarum]|nr:hypothetical protein [Cardiobacterium valvarum]